MNTFDTVFYSIFTYFKPKYKQKSNSIAMAYVSILQCALLLLLGVLFAKFFNQMNMTTMSKEKAWTLFVLVSGFVFFKNWMQYTGKKRMMINAKMNKKASPKYNIWLLLLLPLGALMLAFVLYQAA
ncbi:hypothetical protein ACFSKN_06790 [Mariniflexile gromovii]|uniref:Uncharacterized protein n=1 Tax=Mariniflexile gromovii TaxID=362523 RepID=A0ABS4BQ36_9FLAO|nr:hypothetical protein [Mariniflexile gromovii]MBP0902708.1 hypothetical protein [Mariniflexile gromovii]